MKDEDFSLPKAARSAFELYPALEPSAAFNRAVLERLEQVHQKRRLTLLGRIEEFLGLDIWRFAASGMLGALLPALILGAIYLSNRPTEVTNPTPDIPPAPLEMHPTGPFFAREWELAEELLPPVPAKSAKRSASPTPKGSELSCVDFISHLA